MRGAIIGSVGVIVFAFGIVAAWAFVAPIPAINNFESRAVAQSTKIYDRTGTIVLYDVHGSVRRTAVPLEGISPYLQHATVAIEDAQFYQHKGFRPTSFIRALLVDIASGSFKQGGSTITQQVIKNALLTNDKKISRKLQEIVLALRLERKYSKEQILSTYLNEIPYGGTLYGIQEASQYFFGIDAKDLDLAQSAYLAAIPQAPTHFSPYGNHRDELDARQKLVLKKMKEHKFITDEEYNQALKEKVQFKNEAEAGIKAPHFVFYIRDYLEQKYGADMVDNSGLRVITTLDYDLQQKAEEIVREGALQNATNFDASNASLVAVDPKTGHILTMVGSRGYFDKQIDGMVNIATRPRQPGSSFKPFVYAAALQKGYTPETILFDVKTQFSTACRPNDFSDEPPCYSPENYDGKFAGPITLRNALAQSKNIPSVKLLYLVGIKNALKVAQDFGITTLGNASHYGLTLVLGGGEVNLLELTSAYSVFANEGVRNPPVGILKVEDLKGNVLEEYKEQNSRVIDAEIARQMNDILSDNVARTPEFGANSPLNFANFKVADKTGTTNDYRDTWIVGYTPGIAVGTWAGNNDNSPMQKKIAAFIVAPMWHKFMEYAMQKYPADPFIPPAPETNPDALPAVLRGISNSNPSQGIHEILYWVNKDDPRSGPPRNPRSDPQYWLWEYPVAIWSQQGSAASEAISNFVPESSPTVTQPKQQFHVISPESGGYMSGSSVMRITTYEPDPETLESVTYYLNGEQIGSATTPPYSVSLLPSSRGLSQLKAVAKKKDGGTKEQTVNFTIQ